MKSASLLKLLIMLSLSLVMLLTFTACKDKEIFADNSDFESYPEYWNDFNNDDAGNIYVPQDQNTTTNPSESDDDITNETPDFNVEDTSEPVDTDGDGITNDKDSDIDGDGVENDDDSDIDGDGIQNDKDDDKDGDGITNDGDLTPEGPVANKDKNEGPLVFLN